ncbi:MAG: oxidoreductase [Candidatus Poribacteria bacterium]|nr:MAG: oxidoreductase [Candidatus Poribacteria bacterium]
MKPIDYVRARTLDEAVLLLRQGGERARVLAGGTDLIVQVRENRRDVDLFVDIKNIPETNRLEYDPEHGLTLGAAVPCYRIYGNPAVAKAYPGLIDAVAMIGSVQIQGRATVGGNLCNASPAADSIPPMIVYRGVCHIYGPQGSRVVPVEEFCTGPGQTVLGPGELLVWIHFPPPERHAQAHYLRFTPRNEMDIAVAGSAAYVRLNGERIASARVALSAVAPTPLFVPEVGEYLAGKEITDEVIRQAGELAKAAARPITDMRGTAEQRKHLSAVLTRRALRGAIQRAQEA